MKRAAILLLVCTILMNAQTQCMVPLLIHAGKELATCTGIAALSISAACAYGIINDQITARICPAYFNRGFHRHNIRNMPDCWLKSQLLSDSPTRLGLSWGIIGTWWMGALMSVPIILSTRLGPGHKLCVRDLAMPTICAMILVGLGAAHSGYVGYKKALQMSSEQLYSAIGLWDDVPLNARVGFYVSSQVHKAAYQYGAYAGLGLTAWAILNRILSQR